MTNNQNSPLFQLDDILESDENETVFLSYGVRKSKNEFINSAHDYLSKNVGEIKRGITKHMLSNGRWAMHNLVCYVLEQIEISEIIRTTYAISSEAARLYNRFHEKGLIKHMTYAIDKSAQVRNAKAISLMKPFDMKFIEIHAKIALIFNDKWNITIKGSGNDTQGNRIEDFTLFTDKGTFYFYKTAINDAIKRGATK